MRREWLWSAAAGTIIACAALSAAPADAKRYLTVDEVQRLLFPGQALAAAPFAATKLQLKEIERRGKVGTGGWKPEAWRAPDGSYLFVDRVLGKHEFITFALAVDPKGAARAVEILEYKETYGYEVRGERWRAQFTGKSAAAPVRLEKDIMNIGGATLSCRHVTDGVRRLLLYRDVVLAGVEVQKP